MDTRFRVWAGAVESQTHWSRARSLNDRDRYFFFFAFRCCQHIFVVSFHSPIAYRVYSHLIARLEHRALANFVLRQQSLTRRNLTWVVIYLCARMIRPHFLLIHVQISQRDIRFHCDCPCTNAVQASAPSARPHQSRFFLASVL